jgi:hypothetical protein
MTRLIKSGDELKKWDYDLKSALSSNGPGQAAEKLARAYGFSSRDMRQLVDVWLAADLVNEGDGSYERNNVAREMQTDFVSLANSTNHSPLVMEAAGTVLDEIGGCNQNVFGNLVDGASDRIAAAWLLTSSAQCPAWYGAFASLAPQHATASLVFLSQYGALRPLDQLSLLAYLTSNTTLPHVAVADQLALRVRLGRSYLSILFHTGLTHRAVEILEQLPAVVRARLFDGTFPAQKIHVDGLAVPFSKADADESLKLQYISALLLADRTRDANVLFAPEPADKARAYLWCMYDSTNSLIIPKQCAGQVENDRDILFLDHLLNHPGDDVYPLAEVRQSHSISGTDAETGVDTDIFCRVFSDQQYADRCGDARQRTVDYIRDGEVYGQEFEKDSLAAIRAAQPKGYEKLHQEFKSGLDSAAQQYGGRGTDQRGIEISDEPPPELPFRQLPLPQKYRGKPPSRDNSWIKKLAPLPGGYEPVRIGRGGNRVAVISVSQNYDPTGEVSRGGYWVHLSEDGGKSWQPPLYTGLADRYPYVVLPDSRLPLFDGDQLDVAVDIDELDISSISYPPVALRSKRHETNLYLKIPIAELKRDTAGDGLTDIQRKHLLLWPPKPNPEGGRTPYLVSTIPSLNCKGKLVPGQGARGVILQHLFSVHTGAIIEPIDRDSGGSGQADKAIKSEMEAWSHRDPNSFDRPIFVVGNPQDFACLAPDRLMIVYGKQDIAKLRRMTPDFNAANLSRIIFDRAHDRGFVVWDFGWTGGTFRVRLAKGTWHIELISNWIT